MNEQQRQKRNMLMFPPGTIGRDMIYNLVNNFLLTYVLFTRSLTAPQLAAITAIMVIARVFDAINDPIMGNIIENTRSRWGKFKPWLMAGILSTSFVVIFIFNTKLQGWGFIVAFAIFYFAFSITYTMHDISYWGMIPALGSDADARNQFTSRATLCAGIGGTLAGMLIPMLTTGGMALGGNASTAYGRIAIIVSILSPAFLMLTIFGVQERRDEPAAEKRPALSLPAIVKTIARNDQLMWIALIFLIQQIGNNVVLGGIGSTYIYFEYGYRGGLYSLFTTVGTAITALLMIFYPTISRAIHRKKLMGIMAVAGSVGYAVMLLSGLLMPTSMVKFWIFTGGFMFGMFGQYGYYLIMMISILNTVEYNEYRFGTRDEAVIASLRPFLTKLASALVVLVTTGTYLIFGVTNYTNQISDLESQAAAGTITEAAKLDAIDGVISSATTLQTRGLLLVLTLGSWVLLLLSYVLYVKKYKIDEDEYDRICKELEKR